MDVNAETLQFWKYKLKKAESRMFRRRPAKMPAAIVSSLIDVHPSVSVATATGFEVALGNGRRVRVPAVFEPGALKSLLAVLVEIGDLLVGERR